jgi:exopolyphosphatase/guanosine-5'-triphosphate,3'-diphosphate pyrophosphatase
VVGTEALRRAANADDFLRPAAEILGVPVEVIDGGREAALTFRATAQSFPAPTRAGWLAVVDIGGGSTEIILAQQGTVRFETSLPLGSVRLTEGFIPGDPPTAPELAAADREIATQLVAVPFPAAPVVLCGVAGTVTTLAAMAQNLASYDATKVHGWTLTSVALELQRHRLANATQPQREMMVGLDPRRADVILAGAMILQALLRRSGAPGVLVSDRGIRWGLLYELRETS